MPNRTGVFFALNNELYILSHSYPHSVTLRYLLCHYPTPHSVIALRPSFVIALLDRAIQVKQRCLIIWTSRSSRKVTDEERTPSFVIALLDRAIQVKTTLPYYIDLPVKPEGDR